MSPANAVNSRPPRWWEWPQALSLEAPVVAVLWQLALAKVHELHLLPGMSLGLGLVVWVIYLADRLIDGWKADGRLETARHAFCWRHRRWLCLLWFPLLSLVLLWIGTCLIPEGLLWRVTVIAVLCGIYLWIYAGLLTGPIRAVALSIGGLVGLVLLYRLPMDLPFRFGVSMLLVVIMGRVVIHGLMPGRISPFPKEVAAGGLFALGTVSAVRFLEAGTGGPSAGLETLLLSALFSLNLIEITLAERRAREQRSEGMLILWRRVCLLMPIILVVQGWFGGTPVEVSDPMLITVTLAMLFLTQLPRWASAESPAVVRSLCDFAVALPALVLWLWS